MPAYLSDNETPLTQAQLANGNRPSTTNQSPGNLAQLARTKESEFLTKPPAEGRLAALKNINPAMVNKDFVQGLEAGKASLRDDQKMDILSETQSWNRTDRMEKRQIEEGMRLAAEDGGYAGVVDYLKTMDPDRAIEFDKKKVSLDSDIMQNEVMKTLVPIKQAEALVEGYSALGKMGYALLNAPDKDKPAMYQAMLPMVKQINPNAPSTLNQNAVSMFMLAAAQATPQGILMQNKQNVAYAQSEIGKTSLAMEHLVKQGKQDSEEYKALSGHMQALKSNDLTSQLRATKAQLNMDTQGVYDQVKMLKANTSMAKDIRAAAKPVIESLNTIKDMQPLMQIIDTNGPTSKESALAIVQLRNYMVKLTQGSRPTDKDYERGQAAAGFEVVSKNVKSWMTGSNVALNPSEISQANAILHAWADNNMDSLKNIENGFKKIADGYLVKTADGAQVPIINWEKMALPSQQYQNLQTPTLNAQSLQQQADAAIKAGADPAKVQERMQQLMMQQQKGQ